MKHAEKERAALEAALLRLKLDLNDEKIELLLKHLDLVIEKNQTLNLTRITNYDDAIIRHIEDSLSILNEFESKSGNYLDIGTGAGFPGIPLGIVTQRQGVLLDSVKKKAAAVGEFIQELGLEDQLTSSFLRSEEYAFKNPEFFDVVIARAVATQPVVMELGVPLLRFKGRLVVMKGSESIEDEKIAEKASSRLGLSLVNKRKFKIGDGLFDRSVYVYEKTGRPDISLPRRPGMAAKKPLV